MSERSGLGTMNLSIMQYGQIDSDEKRLEFLDKAFENGMRFWDTAEYVKQTADRNSDLLFIVSTEMEKC